MMVVDGEAGETHLYRCGADETVVEVCSYPGFINEFASDGQHYAVVASIDGETRPVLGEFDEAT